MLNDNQVMEKLGINSWRELSREKFMDYVAIIPDVSEEVRIKVLEQFPECIKFTNDLIEAMKSQQSEAIASNEKLINNSMNSLDAIQKALEKLIDRPDLSSEDIRYICDKQLELAKLYIELCKTHSGFLENVLKNFATFGVVVLTFVASFLGIKFLRKK